MNSKFTGVLSILFLSAALVACKKDHQDQVQKSYNVQLLSQKTLGGKSDDHIIAMTSASDGGYLLAGLSNYDGSSSTYRGDAWIVKLNSNGDTLWTRTMGGAGYDAAFAVAGTTDGGFVLACGTSSNNSGDVGANHGGSDWWIVKLKSNGDTAWTRLIGSTAGEYPTSIAATYDGGFIVCGYIIGLSGNIDLLIAKLNSSGNVVWQKQMGGTGEEYGNDVTVAGDGTILVAAATTSNNNGDVGVNHGMKDYWIIKLSANGDKIWSKLLGGSQDDWASSIKSTPDGGCIIAGASSSSESGNVTGKNHGLSDMWVVKLNAVGDIMWNSLLGGAMNDTNEGSATIAITPESDYVIGGYSNSTDGDVGANQGGNDFWALKLNSTGQKLWAKTFGGSGNDITAALLLNADGSFWLAGFTESNNSGNVGATHGMGDGWIIKIKDN